MDKILPFTIFHGATDNTEGIDLRNLPLKLGIMGWRPAVTFAVFSSCECSLINEKLLLGQVKNCQSWECYQVWHSELGSLMSASSRGENSTMH